MSRGPHAPAPTLERYELRRHIRSGGFADVFLYWDRALDRDVAVKVLASGTATDEAKVMARVSSHPYIVDVYETGNTDDGRPFIVMQYYPGPTFADRLADGPLGLPEALRVTVRLAGALATAHQAGILHRDVKPANVLTNEFGAIGLADFGIATHPTHSGTTAGVSLPWAPPEVLKSEPADVRSDVYSLAATLVTLLEGRPPFVRAHGSNSEAELVYRTLNQAPPELGSDAAPDSLRSLLRAALAKDPAARPRTVEQFGRSLQAVEVDLRLQQTPLDIKQASPAGPRPTDAHETRGRSVRVVDPDVPTDERTRGRSRVAIDSIPTDLPAACGPVAPLGDGGRLPEPPPLDDTFVPAAARVGDAPEDPGPSRLRWIAVVAGVALVIAAVAVVSLAGSDGGGGSSPDGSTPTDVARVTTTRAQDDIAVRNLEVLPFGTAAAIARWSAQPAAPSGWVVRRSDPQGLQLAPQVVHEPQYLITGLGKGDRPCVLVGIVGHTPGPEECLLDPIGGSS